MTKFQDGPAQGQILIIRRAPIFLRVVEKDGKWDALDQPDDSPNPGETIYAYQLAEVPGSCHIHASGGRGGFYPLATYRFIADQPAQGEMSSTIAWINWVEANKHRAIVRPTT